MSASRQIISETLRNRFSQSSGSEREFERRARVVPSGMPTGALRRGRGPLASLMRRHVLHPSFHPIACLREGSVYAHEALIRGAPSTALYSPDGLLAAAENEDLNFEFETQCVSVALNH